MFVRAWLSGSRCWLLIILTSIILSTEDPKWWVFEEWIKSLGIPGYAAGMCPTARKFPFMSRGMAFKVRSHAFWFPLASLRSAGWSLFENSGACVLFLKICEKVLAVVRSRPTTSRRLSLKICWVEVMNTTNWLWKVHDHWCTCIATFP